MTDVNFEGCDLRGVTFNRCRFNKVKLNKALLADGFRFDGDLKHKDLVYLYVFLLFNDEEKANALNKVLGPLQLRLNRIKLKGYILRGINLANATLRDADLRNTDLVSANLTHACLRDASLDNSDLTDANLEWTDLSDAGLHRVRLSQDLELPNYHHINKLFYLWRDANDQDKPYYQKLLNAKVGMLLGVPIHILQQFDWTILNLQNVNFDDCHLEGIDFTGNNLENSSFKSSHLERAVFRNVNAKNSNFAGSNFTIADFRNADLENSRLIFSNVINNANIEGANLKNTSYQLYYYTNQTINVLTPIINIILRYDDIINKVLIFGGKSILVLILLEYCIEDLNKIDYPVVCGH